ncbi:TetR/AcrR family transcriptional regulator [Streptomyces mirabilis]|uniref:TetR/AcrR family transcriptional regulator n=1 Tax=Streptomyces mirabilis TaxID=68239 RepID=UPI0033BAEDE6
MGRPRSFSEDSVLSIVREQFWTHGYSNTSTYDLMNLTGLGKGSIYKAFGNKKSLYMNVFTTYCDNLVKDAQEILSEASGSPLDRIEKYLTSIARDFSRDTEHRGCFLSRGTVDLAPSDAAVAQKARESFDLIAKAFADAVREAQEVGEVDTNADARLLGYLMLTVIRGIDTVAKAGVDEETLVNTVRTAVALLPAP